MSVIIQGKTGGEVTELITLGVGYNGDTPEKPLPGLSPKISRTMTLSTEWQEVVFNLNGVDLSYVLGGFGWVVKATDNPGKNEVVFYIDNIRFNK